MKKIININLDLFKEDSFRKFDVKQFDDITLNIRLLNNNSTQTIAEEDIKFLCKKEDGTVLYQEEGISVNGNIITVKMKNQATACVGNVYAELEFVNSEDGRVTSSTFNFLVREKVGNLEDAIESVDEIYILDKIDEFIKTSKEQIKEIEDKLEGGIGNIDDKVAELNRYMERAEDLIVRVKNENSVAIKNRDDLHEKNSTANTLKIQLRDINANSTQILADLRGLLEGDVKEAKDTLEEQANVALELKNTLNNLLEQSVSIKNDLELLVPEGVDLVPLLTDLVSNAGQLEDRLTLLENEINASFSSMETKIEEAKTILENLTLLNTNASNNILELENLNPASVSNIEELSFLIEEAKRVAGLVRAFIDNFEPAQDLTEVNERLESIFNAIHNIEEELEANYVKKINGTIAKSATLPEAYDNLHEIQNQIDFEPADVIYMFANGGEKVFYFRNKMYGVIETTTGVDYNFFSTTRTIEEDEYVCFKQWAGKWERETIYSAQYVFNNTYYPRNIYASTFNIKKVNEDVIVIPATNINVNNITDFDSAKETGIYNVIKNVGDNITNAPQENIQGLLKVSKSDNLIEQILVSETASYSRKYSNNIWSEWKNTEAVEIDLTGYATEEYVREEINKINIPEVNLEGYATEQFVKDEINKIDIPEADLSNYYNKEEVDKKINTYKGEIGYSEYKQKPEGFDEAFEKLLENPQVLYPNMKGNVVGYIQGTISRQTGTNASGTRIPGVILFTDNGNFYNELKPTITNSATTNREFDIVQLKTMADGNVNSTNRNSMSYPCIIDSKTGEFINGYMPGSSYHYTITDYYYSTVDVYNADDTIAYPACQGEIETKISDFDEAIESGNYKVNIKEGEIIKNTPLEGAIQGILNVNKAKNVIHQELSTNKDEVFSRIYLNSNWTEWKTTGASDIDMTNIYTKEEVNELVGNISVDLSAYSTTEEIKTLLNESIGTVRASLIRDINDIVGGI